MKVFVAGWHGPWMHSRKGVLEKTHTQAPLHPRVVRSSRLYSELRVPSTRHFDFLVPFRFSFCGVPAFISQFQIAAFSFICDCRLDHVAGH